MAFTGCVSQERSLQDCRSERYYSSESQLNHPRRLMIQMGQDLLASRELAWQLMVRDIRAQYRQSFLGIFWAFVPPVVTAIGLLAAKNANLINIAPTDLPYPAYVMFSTALWQTFAEAVSGPIQGVTSAKPMLVRINFPREALILAQMGLVFFNFGIKLILILGLFLWFRIIPSPSILLAPVALVHLVFLGISIGTLLAPIGALYTDISRGLTFGLGFWMLMTPVIYPVPTQGWLASVIRFNPVTPLLVTVRELATTGQVSNSLGFWLASGLALGTLVFSWLVYRLAMPFVVERMSA